jgi:hypothetical protein
MKLTQNLQLRCFVKHSLQYTGLSGFGSKGTSESVPQSEHLIGYIFRSSDMISCNFTTIRTKIF